MSVDPTTGLPTDASLAALMAPWRGARARILGTHDRRGRPLGNHGDWLMLQVFQRLLRAYNIEVTAARTPPPDLLVIPPNGSLLDTYQFPSLLKERLARQPDLPLVIFPSSSQFKNMDPALMFGTRRSPTTWMLREAYSFNHLRDQWGESLGNANVTLALGHDVVASGHRFVPEVFAGHANGPAAGLLVARLGAEATVLPDRIVRGSLLRRALINAYLRVPSDRVKIAVRRRVTKSRQQTANARMLDSVGTVVAQRLSSGRLSSLPLDISDPQLATLDEYLSEIASATLVVTNRLHVALPSAILGKETFLVDSGYHKLVGVYEQSLVDVPNIQFVHR